MGGGSGGGGSGRGNGGGGGSGGGGFGRGIQECRFEGALGAAIWGYMPPRPSLRPAPLTTNCWPEAP